VVDYCQKYWALAQKRLKRLAKAMSFPSINPRAKARGYCNTIFSIINLNSFLALNKQ
jgi:hypothetical protein